MRPRDRQRARVVQRRLTRFANQIRPLPGIANADARMVFVEQLFESIHRVAYVGVVNRRRISQIVQNPGSASFDPIKAAILAQRMGNLDEACWLVFLSVHFGKHARLGWRFVRDIYGANGNVPYWTWERVSADPEAFREWLAGVQEQFQADGAHRFGNHRKYVSIDARSDGGTGAAVQSYCEWILQYDDHQGLFEWAQDEFGDDSGEQFDGLYHNMDVMSFGRMAKFDYLTMIGKLLLAPVQPSSLYMTGATGPARGARLMFGGNTNADIPLAELDNLSIRLATILGVGAQEMEDSLCNWQKSPTRLIRYRG